ncbi:juvenile hormone epoxide hydrolase-like [Contarinia nasturtii]|uniref:juvenile hormone epoxide hydrolase-like n=1 Tax=Contarinia nasturtii TaxID=265458 RepID=UPI0012D470B6|nr:juvenile hormone epoxide hydrolase-like [Contarinia nasturtii]
MGVKCFSVTVTVVAVFACIAYQILLSPLPPPKISTTKYWGPSSQANRVEKSEVKPFKINYSADVISKLSNRLSEPLNLVEPLKNVNFRYGFDKHKLEELVKYWRDEYLPKWDGRQKFFNALPQYTTKIQGLNIHFIHTKDQTDKAKYVIPLLLLHGWPSSVREFYNLIPELTKAKDNIAFVVVAPSLPGYGFSEAAKVPGMNPNEIAIVFRNLMVRLGYDRFLIQGSDWGSLIGSSLAALFPQNVIGFHSNMCVTGFFMNYIKAIIASVYPSLFVAAEYADFHFPIGEKIAYHIEESGYFHLQATKPDTIGIALTANPVGLLAYILEKFSTLTDKNNRDLIDGGLDKHYTKEALLDNIMIYYLSNSITTSVRLYAEGFGIEYLNLKMDRVPVQVPVGCARFKNDLAHELDWQLNVKFPKLIHSTYHANGGHFAAMELPDVLYNDFLQFVNKLNVTAKK